jgi:hypothetical protein
MTMKLTIKSTKNAIPVSGTSHSLLLLSIPSPPRSGATPRRAFRGTLWPPKVTRGEYPSRPGRSDQVESVTLKRMKRSESLEQLSRDHHRALEAALKLRRATDFPMIEQAVSNEELARLAQDIQEAERSG